MFTIRVEGVDQVATALRRTLAASQKVGVRAINYLGREVRKGLTAQIPQRFASPTPFTLRGIRSTTATVQRPETQVGFKELDVGRPEHYLEPQVEGGGRPLKRLERLLRDKGILPEGMFVVPGPAARKDQYGNWSRGEIQQVLAALGASADPLTRTDLNRTRGTRRGIRPAQRKRRLYWVGRPGTGRLPLGIWAVGETVGKRQDRIRPVAWITRQPRYTRRWDFHGEARHIARAKVMDAIKQAWNETIS